MQLTRVAKTHATKTHAVHLVDGPCTCNLIFWVRLLISSHRLVSVLYVELGNTDLGKISRHDELFCLHERMFWHAQKDSINVMLRPQA